MPRVNTVVSLDPAKNCALTECEITALSSTVLGVSPFWKVSVKTFLAPSSEGATMAALVFWSGRTDCYRPIIGLTATRCGYDVTRCDIREFIASGVWPRSRHEGFDHALLAVEQAVRKVVEWAELGIEQSPLLGFPSPPCQHPMNRCPSTDIRLQLPVFASHNELPDGSDADQRSAATAMQQGMQTARCSAAPQCASLGLAFVPRHGWFWKSFTGFNLSSSRVWQQRGLTRRQLGRAGDWRCRPKGSRCLSEL